MIKNIVIVGGGSSGWMTAAYLSNKLENVAITLIESSDIPVIGVGESTIVPIVKFLEALDLEETDWMPRCNATYKSAIRFENFHRTDEPPFWYNFEPMVELNGRPLSRFWYNRHLTDPGYKDRFSFYEYCFITPEMLRQDKTLRSVTGKGPAYHLDAGLLGEFLMEYATSRGVTREIDTITGVNRADNGNIASLSRENGPDLGGDLFIDCTGFRSVLMGQTLEEPFEDYYSHLFNDRAVAIRYPYQEETIEQEMFSHTNCTALSAGWVWQIPLFDITGSGYVYCSRYKTEDEAEEELKRFLGYERTKDLPVKHIRIRVGKHSRNWVGNCVTIGLSSGFIEPLESTGLFIVQHQAETLGHILARNRNDYNATDVKVFNKTQTDLFEGIRDFLVCHYALTEREDTPYWRDVKYATEIPDSLGDLLRFARMTIPDLPVISQIYRANFGDFSFADGWQSVLIGMNHLPFQFDQFQNTGPFEEAVVKGMPLAAQRHRSQEQFKAVEIPKFPSHYEFLKQNIHTSG